MGRPIIVTESYSKFPELEGKVKEEKESALASCFENHLLKIIEKIQSSSEMSANEDVTVIRKDIDELKGLIELAKSERVKSFLSIELRRWETKLANQMESEKKSNTASAPSVPTKTVAQTSRSYDVQIKNYSWEESDLFVKVYLTGLDGAKDLDKEAFEFNVETTSIFFKINNMKGKNMIFNIKETSGKINTEKSYYKAKSDMVVIFLKKEDANVKWVHLKKIDKETSDKPKFTPKVEDNNADPSAGLMNMMKQMYAEGDDDMKRTIAKAWTESSTQRNTELDKLDL